MNFSSLITAALTKAGKQESLATVLDLSPSALSKRLNAEVGWTDREINKLLEYAGLEICHTEHYTKQIRTLKETLKIYISGDEV